MCQLSDILQLTQLINLFFFSFQFTFLHAVTLLHLVRLATASQGGPVYQNLIANVFFIDKQITIEN